MDERIKKLWIEALRSGKYKQGFGRLQDECNGYCCFGVLELLAVEDGAIPEFTPERKYCSDEVVEWAGLPSFNPAVPVQDREDAEKEYLAAINDRHCDFTFIADRIEKCL